MPTTWAELMQKQIPNSELKVSNDEGHLIIFHHAQEIFADLK